MEKWTHKTYRFRKGKEKSNPDAPYQVHGVIAICNVIS